MSRHRHQEFIQLPQQDQPQTPAEPFIWTADPDAIIEKKSGEGKRRWHRLAERFAGSRRAGSTWRP
jgi:hypothetical protein